MYDRDLIADAYEGVPRIPRDDLIDLTIRLLEATSGGSTDDELATCCHRAFGSEPTPDDIIDQLMWVIDSAGDDQPLSWHVERIQQAQELQVSGISSRVHSLMEISGWIWPHLPGKPHTRFLFRGLRGSLTSEVLAIVESYPHDLDTVPFLIVHEGAARKVSPEFAQATLHAALDILLLHGQPCSLNPDNFIVQYDGVVPEDLHLWVRAVTTERPDAYALLASYSRPLPNQIFVRGGAVTGERGDRVPRPTPVGMIAFDVRQIARPQWATEPLDPGVGAWLKAQPQHRWAFIHQLGGPLGEGGPLQEQAHGQALRQLGALGVDVLTQIVKLGWTADLAGVSELVALAEQITDPKVRKRALNAIREPASEIVVGEIRDALARFREGALSESEVAWVRDAADENPAIGLRFWQKELARHPRVASLLLSSRRISSSLLFDPTPLHRLFRRFSSKSEHHDALARCADGAVHLGVSLDVVRDEIRRHGLGGPLTITKILAEDTSDEATRILQQKWADFGGEISPRLIEQVVLRPQVWRRLTMIGLLSPSQVHRALVCRPPRGVVASDVATTALQGVIEDVASGIVHADAGHNSVELALELLRQVPSETESIAFVRVRDVLMEQSIDLERIEHARLSAPIDPRLVLPDVPTDVAAALFGTDFPLLAEGIGAHLAQRVLAGTMMESHWEFLRQAGEGLVTTFFGEEDGEAVLVWLESRWPSRLSLEAAVEELSLAIAPSAWERWQDALVPPIFRAAVSVLPRSMENAGSEAEWSPESLVLWVLDDCWCADPSLAARHLLPALEEAPAGPWRRAVASALVALREPVGTKVPDALTRLRNAEEEGSAEREFLHRQRDAFRRGSVAQAQRAPAQARCRQAWKRLLRGARRQRQLSV